MAVSALADLTICEALSLVSSIFKRIKCRSSFLYSTLKFCITPKSRGCICDVDFYIRIFFIYWNVFHSTHGGDSRVVASKYY